MIICLFFMLLALVCINYKVADCDFFNPSVLASGSFVLFSFFSCLSYLYIGIDIETVSIFFVIGIGLGIFTINGYLFSSQKKKENLIFEKEIFPADVNAVWPLSAVFILLLTLYVNYNYISAFGSMYGASDFFTAIVQYKAIMTFHDADDILLPPPWYRNYLSLFSTVFAYLFSYLFMREKIYKRQFQWGYFLVIVLYGIYTLMGGGRSGLFQLITALLFFWYAFSKSNATNPISNKKILARLMIIGLAIIIGFVFFIVAIGRTQNDFDIEYVISSVFVYAGAPIFNLDIYLQNPWSQTHGLWGELTFIRLINWIGTKFSISSFVYELDLPFLSYLNYNLGNVYTTFYAFYYDFQFIGVVLLSIGMSLLSIWLYNKVLKQNLQKVHISLVTIYYAYLVNDLIMLPFSNRFYEDVINVGTLYKAILLFILVYYLNHYEFSFQRGLKLMRK